MKKYITDSNRAFVSFGGKCAYKCSFCYTFSPQFNTVDIDKLKSIDDVLSYVHNLKKKNNSIKIIYISGYRENFIKPDEGINLLETLFSEFKCHILFTTRNVFTDHQIERVKKLSKIMKCSRKCLFACVSISAYDTYEKIEPNSNIPSPPERINFLKQLHANEIITFLALRPIFPDFIIPTGECIKIIDEAFAYCDAIIASEFRFDEDILQNLAHNEEITDHKTDFWSCFDGMAIEKAKVDNEMQIIKAFCIDKAPLYNSSIPAINDIIRIKLKQ